MSKILDYIRLSFFACGLLLGVQIPAYVSDFGQALNAQLIEANNAIAPFKKDAERYFNNDLDKLISHYQNLDDDIASQGATHLKRLAEREKTLEKAVTQFANSPYLFTLTSDLSDIKLQVWQRFEGQIILKQDSITAAVIAAITIALFAEFIGFMCLTAIKRGCVYLVSTRK